jgi:soluble lytic murein transglycosylase
MAGLHRFAAWLLTGMLLAVNLQASPASASEAERELFKQAWAAAGRGDHEQFRDLKRGLKQYSLYPYLQYEDYRHRRAVISTDEMLAFLHEHEDWAFSSALKQAWLKTLASEKRWAELVRHAGEVTDTGLQCQLVRGKIIIGQTQDLLAEAQKLWVAGKSQPRECDPVFAWLVRQGGITETLAWQRIGLAMLANNRSLAGYLSRYVPKPQRAWIDEWATHSRAGYSRLEQIRRWPDNDVTRSIARVSLERLARDDAHQAARKFQMLDSHFNWSEDVRAGLLRDIALYSAVALNDDTAGNMEKVPPSYRDSQLLEWWARFLLSRQDWTGLILLAGQFPQEMSNDDRWRYWVAQARKRSGQLDASNAQLAVLADKASYYGFLAADELGLDYNICPQTAEVEQAWIDRLAGREDFQRALELRQVELYNWATAEWSRAAARLPVAELKVAAALARREGWDDRVIFALGNSGDLRLYEWRFPLTWQSEINREASKNRLDPAWVFGTIRSESAMQETARSPANAMGLMQIMPATGKRVAKKNHLAWSGIAQLRTAQGNIPIGTAYMRELLEDFSNNPVLVSGAYNAGPNAVSRWLKTRPLNEASIWIETLPYFETRDYIPRVLAFTTIYDWRLDGKVKRISVRMPHIESGKIGASGSADVVCRGST